MAGTTMTGSDTMRFKVHCVEEYSLAHDIHPSETLSIFDRFGVFDFLNLDVLRWQPLSDTLYDIDEYIEARC
jgi:hypothetical protein